MENMFYSITGNIIFQDTSSVAVECAGVGFRCFTSAVTLAQIQGMKTVTLYTHLSVKEDALDLYGFYDESELECFKLLISVTGVGPKAAINILSVLTPDSLALAVASGDSKSITKAQGVGSKIAQRIVLELQGKLTSVLSVASDAETFQNISAVSSNENIGEAVEALVMLGFSQSDATSAVSSLDHNLSVEKLITGALKILSGR